MRGLNLAGAVLTSRSIHLKKLCFSTSRYVRPRKPGKLRLKTAQAAIEESSESNSDLEPVCEKAIRKFEKLKQEMIDEEDSEYDSPLFGISTDDLYEDSKTSTIMSRPLPDYRIPHRFIGFDPRRMDLEDLPLLRTDFDGKRSKLIWMGTECQRCGLQIRREKRSNRESSLNVYASPTVPDDLMRSCPGRKQYPVLWRTRDPYVALDILGIEDF